MTTQISDWTDLDNVRNDLSGDYELVNDLDSNTSGYTGTGDSWTPLGDSANAFTGTFDGGGYAIRDLSCSVSARFVGLFAAIGGTVTDLSVLSASVSNGQSTTSTELTGVLAGDINGGTVRRCVAAGSVSGSDNFVGGLAGRLFNNATVDRCAASVSVSGGSSEGGLVGDNDGTISDSYATGATNGTGLDAGGGLVAINSDDIDRSYAATSVADGGGLVGLSRGNETNAYWDTQASGQSTSDGDAVGLSTSEMQGATAAANMAGLTFYPTWSRVDGSDNASGDGYPILRDIAVGPQASLQSVSITDYYQLPQNLALTATNDPDVTEATVELSWSDPADGEAGYRIYRSDVSSPSFPGDFTAIKDTIPDVESYADEGAAFNTDYEYRVAAFESGVEATPRATATVSVGQPGPYNIVITGTNSPVGVGETLEIDVDITNTGSLGGETEATVDLTEQ